MFYSVHNNFAEQTLPEAVCRNEIAPYIRDSDQLRTHRVSKETWANTSEDRNEIKKRIFYENFGKIARSDESLSFQDLGSRITNILKLLYVQGTFSNGWPQLNYTSELGFFVGHPLKAPLPVLQISNDMADDKLSDAQKLLTKINEPALREGLSFWEKYSLYRGDHLRELYQKVQAIYMQHDQILQEFENDPTPEQYPLQDIVDRQKRIATINEEKCALENTLSINATAWETFFEKLCSPWENIAFSCIYIFDFIFSDPINALTYPKSKRLFLKWQHKFKEMNIQFNGNTIPLEIFGQISRECTIFQIKGKHIGTTYGFFTLSRKWSRPYDKNFYDEKYIRALNMHREGKTLVGLRSYLSLSNFYDRLGLSQDTQDLPISKLLMQIALEVFNRESELQMDISEADPDTKVKLASFGPGERVNFFNKKRITTGSQETDRVDFRLMAENKIFLSQEATENSPPLLKGEGPILPKFYITNPKPYELDATNLPENFATST